MAMKKNVGTVDRVVRIIAGLVLFVIGIQAQNPWVMGILIVVGVLLLLTGVIGYCGPYKLLGIDTTKKQGPPAEG